MIKIGEKTFFLVDDDGNEIPWTVTDLQSELIYCFLSCGLAENSCFAEDVALAVEFSLQQSEEAGCCVRTAEMLEIVVKTLENSGFYNAAECFRKRNSRELEVLFSTSLEGLKHVVDKHGIFGQGSDVEEVVKSASAAFGAIGIAQAPLGLIVEMLRYFHRSIPLQTQQYAAVKKKIKGDYLFHYKDVTDKVPAYLYELVDGGILRINDVTVYHPSIRIYLDIMEFARFRNMKPLLTEMFWGQYGCELGQSFDALIEAMQSKYADLNAAGELPVYLTINNMERFAEYFFGVSGKCEELAHFIVGNLAENMFNTFYKVRF